MIHDILLYIQPAYNCMTKEIEYAEVLIRRYRGIEGVGSILKFVERHELQEQFDLDILEATLCEIHNIERLQYPIGVNLCPSTISKDDLIPRIKEIMNTYEANPNDIIIEINEGTKFNNQTVFDNVQRLHEMGIKVALDDFGVEKANLYSILHYKFDILKVDKSFIGHESEESKNEILNIIKSICCKFNIKPIIEGVETTRQLKTISSLGYTVVQGFLYAKPIPLKDFIAL